MKDSGLARAKASIELSLWNKLDGPLRRNSIQTLLNMGTVRAKAITTSELSLFIKFERITALERGQGATDDNNPEGCQGIKGNLHVKVSFDNPHT